MKFSFRDTFSLLKDSFSEWNDDDALRHSAALAYYTVFSIAPLLIIVVAVAGALWPESGVAKARLMTEITRTVGPDSAGFIQELLDNAQKPGSGGIFATVVGVVTLLIGSTVVFAQLQASLNSMWEVKLSPDYGIKGLIMARVLSFGLILTIGFLLLVSLVLTVFISALSSFIGAGGALEPLWQTLNFLVSFGIVTLLFAMMYRYLPDADIAWRDTWIGALITAFLFTVGKLGIGLYLGSSSVASSYGAAGSLVLLLLWVFYSAAIFFFGAEVTQVFARRFGKGILPSKHAVRVVQETVETTREEAQRLARTSSHADHPRVGAVAQPSAKTSILKRSAPFAAAFIVGRLTKRRRVEVVKKFVR